MENNIKPAAEIGLPAPPMGFPAFPEPSHRLPKSPSDTSRPETDSPSEADDSSLVLGLGAWPDAWHFPYFSNH